MYPYRRYAQRDGKQRGLMTSKQLRATPGWHDSPVEGIGGGVNIPAGNLTADQVNKWLQNYSDIKPYIGKVDQTFLSLYTRRHLFELHLTGPDGEPYEIDGERILSLDFDSQIAYWINALINPLIEKATSRNLSPKQ